MSANGEGTTMPGQRPQARSRLSDYADMAGGPEQPRPVEIPPPTASPSPVSVPEPAAQAGQADVARREFAAVLGEFRRTAVLVPRVDGAWLTADLGGVRWILAFSDEEALARYAVARGEGRREWVHERVLGARILDVAVPAAGVPCGVALDAADGAEYGVVFPPVAGIVPERVAVDVGAFGTVDGEGGRP